jgi:hypothetical protein
MIGRLGRVIVLAAVLGALAGAAPAAAAAPPPPTNPVCGITAPVEEANLGQDLVCSAEASAQVSVSSEGPGTPCIQVYPYSEVCDGFEAGAGATVHGHGDVLVCAHGDSVLQFCGPVFVEPHPDALP